MVGVGFVYLGIVSGDIAFEWTMEATAFQTQETACAKAGEQEGVEHSGKKEVISAGVQSLKSLHC